MDAHSSIDALDLEVRAFSCFDGETNRADILYYARHANPAQSERAFVKSVLKSKVTFAKDSTLAGVANMINRAVCDTQKYLCVITISDGRTFCSTWAYCPSELEDAARLKQL